jgi:hypothetical protein
MHGDEGESDDDDVGDVLEAIGYSRLHMLTKLDQESGSTNPSGQYYLDPKDSAQLKRALDVLPPRHIVGKKEHRSRHSCIIISRSQTLSSKAFSTSSTFTTTSSTRLISAKSTLAGGMITPKVDHVAFNGHVFYSWSVHARSSTSTAR